MFSPAARAALKAALNEDVGPGDKTSNFLVPSSAWGSAVLVARESGIFCGGPVIRELLRVTDRRLACGFFVSDGKPFRKSKILARIQGPVRGILKAERTLLNLLGRLSGIATLTREYVRRVSRYGTRILDTRKTTPLWRELEKYAVRTGGGKNHRMGLYDEIFVKENHKAHGRLGRLSKIPRRFFMEVRNLRELKEALVLKPRVILFDNFPPARLKGVLKLARRSDPRILLEASGGIHLGNVARYARLGLDQISIGRLTHSPKSMDFSLLIEK